MTESKRDEIIRQYGVAIGALEVAKQQLDKVDPTLQVARKNPERRARLGLRHQGHLSSLNELLDSTRMLMRLATYSEE